MPISPIVLQRRHAELGRIRLGNKGDRGQPQKLSSFRFTSPSEAYIRDLAELYGGTPQPWDNAGKAEWEVFTTAQSIPVIAVKGGLSQWLEFWQGGGCVHRCDGETNVLTGEACDLEEQVKTRVKGKDVWVNPHTEAKPTTRLSVMLPELEGIGVWRMESHGWNAAAEIPAVAELALYVGDLVPAHLHLVERRTVRDGQTSRFVVPVLDLQIGVARLREIVAEKSGATPQVEAQPERKAIESGNGKGHGDDWLPTLDDIKAAQTRDAVVNIWRYLKNHDALTDELEEACTNRVADLTGHRPAPQTERSEEAVWQDVLACAGELGWTETQLHEEFAKANGGVVASAASVGEMEAFLQRLQQRTEGAA